MHFFNPPSIMPLVEIIPGTATSPETVHRAASLALHLGKTPIVVRDCPGFLVNRLLMPYLNESVRLVEEGADFGMVDRLLEDFGMPMGPFALLDEIGIDVATHVAAILGRAFADRMEPVSLLSSVAIAGGLLGKKSGQGFYLYGRQRPAGPGRRANPMIRHLLPAPSSNALPFDIVHRPLLAMLNEAARVLEERVVSSPGELDLALVLGTGFPPFRGGLLRWAEEELEIRRACELLEIYARTFGSRFAPAPLLDRLAAEGRRFSAA